MKDINEPSVDQGHGAHGDTHLIDRINEGIEYLKSCATNVDQILNYSDSFVYQIHYLVSNVNKSGDSIIQKEARSALEGVFDTAEVEVLLRIERMREPEADRSSLVDDLQKLLRVQNSIKNRILEVPSEKDEEKKQKGS